MFVKRQLSTSQFVLRLVCIIIWLFLVSSSLAPISEFLSFDVSNFNFVQHLALMVGKPALLRTNASCTYQPRFLGIDPRLSAVTTAGIWLHYHQSRS